MQIFELAAESKWGLFVEGQTTALLFGIIFFAVVYGMITRARAGMPLPQIRRLPGIDAVDEAVGRATEMGRAVMFHPGRGDLRQPETIAGFAMLGYASHLCARYDTRIIQMHWQPMVLAVGEEITRQSYLEAGRPDSFNPDDVMFISNHEAVALGVIEKEKPGAQIYWGQFFAESMSMIEVGAMVGSIQVGASASTAQLPFFVAGCDYALIGEEMYAAGAYLSKEPVQVGTVVGQDWVKIALILSVVAGALITTITGDREHFFTSLFRM